ncbi:MAG: hypothetical protein RIC35_23070 [Marinoscillum sp.]
MKNGYPDILTKNKLTVTETGERIIIRFRRNNLYLLSIGLVGLAFLVTGFWNFELKILLVSTVMAVLCLLSIIRKWHGRTIFIIDHLNSQLIFPSNNRYEQTSGIDTKEITGICSEQAGDGSINYIFVELTNNKPELLLTLRTETLQELRQLLNWLESQLQKETVTNIG